MIPLPIDPHLAEARALVDRHGSLVLVAPPGSGKTTRVPPALLGPGPLILLQPRRVAARSLARRIAAEQGFELGREVGWHVRFEREFSAATRLLVATEGILTARLAQDPLLSGFATVVLDEFHERSLHADLALALVRQAREARGDLRVVVMSATLDAGPVAEYLGGAPVLEVAGSPYPLEICFAPGLEVASAVRRVLAGPGGHVLAFLPGAREIRDAAVALAGLDVRPLHGSLPPDEQDRALAACAGRKVILATNVAETSLTVEGVTDVVDSGLQRVLRYDPERALDRLVTERVALDSAVQRAGRAGRTGPGRALRLWDERDRLRARREPEIARVDLAPPLLEVLAWGGDPRAFPWFEAPPPERVQSSLELLRRLGAFDGRRITPLGETLRRFPLHPRLARVLVAAGGGARAAAACAVLSERPFLRSAGVACDSDVLLAVDRLRDAPFPVRQAAREIGDLARRLISSSDVSDDELRRALFDGFPDRLAQRRSPRSPRLLMISGSGAVLGRESGVHEGEFLVALDVAGGDSGEPFVRQASRVEPEWLVPDGEAVGHRLEGGRVRAVLRETLGALLLAERHVAPDPVAAARLLAAALLPTALEGALARRLRFAGLDVDLPALLEQACLGATELRQVDLGGLLPHAVRRDLDRLAPERLPLPSGRTAAIEYREDGTAVAEAKLQELFGLSESPRLGPRQEPVLLGLLAPNGRPVQLTRDLRSFWERTYPEVRKELRGRYPRHPWPEDPWTAEPTHRAKRRT